MYPLPLPLGWLAWVPPVFGFAVIPREPERRREPPRAVEPWAAEELRRNRAMARRFPPVTPLPKMLF